MVIIPNCGRQRETGQPGSAEPLGQWTRVTAAATHTNGKLSELTELVFLHSHTQLLLGETWKDMADMKRHDQHSFGDD